MSIPTDQHRQHRWGAIPKPLREHNQWLVTKDGSPVQPAEGWQHPENQLSFRDVCRMAKKRNGKPAFALHSEDPFVILDFDDVRDSVEGQISDEVAAWIERLPTYSEISRSGTGLHLVCEGAMLPGRNETGELDEQGKVEVFDSGQYVILTGRQIRSYDAIKDFTHTDLSDDNALLELQREYLPEQTESVEKNDESPDFELESVSNQSLALTPEEIRRTLEEYAKDERKGAERTLNRWNSSPGSALEFPSGSEADLGFVSDLAYWCGEGAKLIDQCFRRSRRMREKWDEVHYANGRTYGEVTIQKAINSNYDTFSGHYVGV
ncbi:phage NrS-1 polymerase family protein [Natrialbaceae archaeon A-gly3]